jgi:glycosyltransferase involved in cell wall biosynthesis
VKVAFLMAKRVDISPETPYSQPLGGMQSAACYLSAELAKRGHSVALVSHIKVPGRYLGVECPGWDFGHTRGYLNRFDVVVVVGLACGLRLRRAGVSTRLILWTGHSFDRLHVRPLVDAAERAAWDGFALKSRWQTHEFSRRFRIPPEAITIQRNAIAPPFEKIERDQPLFPIRATGPELVYTSTPFRGLGVLLTAFPMIRAQLPECRVSVYSSMAVYRFEEKDRYRAYYDECRALDGIEYKGSVGQSHLAQALGGCDILAYPNTFAETSCIAVMEAMAAGCLVVTSTLGALPETMNGHGVNIRPPRDKDQYAREFSSKIVEVCRQARLDPDAYQDRIDRQVEYIRSTHTWSIRAQEWQRWLSG